MTITKQQRVIATVVSTVGGGLMGWYLSGNQGTTQRERVLSTFLGATAVLGATHTVINVLATED